MTLRNLYLTSMMLMLAGLLAACSETAKQSPDVSDTVRAALDQNGLKDVSVSQDRDKGVVTLDGHVATDEDKANAESLTKGLAGGQVVANQIAVLPPAAESDAKSVNSALDQGIEKNLDAALIQAKLQKLVKYEVKNGVVTLTGAVNSAAQRMQAEKTATNVPNVAQVVNELAVENEKATSTR